MTIEEIEALLSRLSKEPEDLPLNDASLQLANCFLLLQIYKKLESIEKKVEPRPLPVIYSKRVL